MKKLILIAVIGLSGCSTISSMWPKPHDPVMFNGIVETKISFDKLNCDDKTKNWDVVETNLEKLKVYTELRKDPQATSISQLKDAVAKAKGSDKKLFCESILKINKTRIDVIVDAWKGR